MRPIHSLVIAVLAPILANCSTHPLVDDVTRTTTFDIVEKIRCEAKRAVKDYGKRLGDDTTIAYEFEFDIKEDNHASGNATWFLPLTGGNFSLKAGAGSDLTREAKRNFTLTDTFGDLRNANCSPETLEKNWIYPIAGEIGIYEVVETFAKLHDVENENLEGDEKFSFSDVLTFTTFLGAGVNPTLNLVNDRSRVTHAEANLRAQRLDTHKVTITIKGGRHTATGVARLSPRSSGGLPRSGSPSVIRSALRTTAGAPRLTTAGAPGAIVTNNVNLSTTLLQTGPDPRQNAILELDRVRSLALQQRVLNQVVQP
jgi:hypothetical protein